MLSSASSEPGIWRASGADSLRTECYPSWHFCIRKLWCGIHLQKGLILCSHLSLFLDIGKAIGKNENHVQFTLVSNKIEQIKKRRLISSHSLYLLCVVKTQISLLLLLLSWAFQEQPLPEMLPNSMAKEKRKYSLASYRYYLYRQ